MAAHRSLPAAAGLFAFLLLACLYMPAAHAQAAASSISRELVPNGAIFYKPPAVKNLKLYQFPDYTFRFPQCGPRDDMFSFQFTFADGGYVAWYKWSPADYSTQTANSIVNGITEITFNVQSGLLRVSAWGVFVTINMNMYLPTDPYQKQYKGTVKPTNPVFWNTVDKEFVKTTIQTKSLATTALHLLGRAAAKFGEGKAVNYPCREKKTIPGDASLRSLSAYLHELKKLVA